MTFLYKLKDWSTWVVAFLAWCGLFMARMISDVEYTLGDLWVFAVALGTMYKHPEFVKKHGFLTFVLFTLFWCIYMWIFKHVYSWMRDWVKRIFEDSKKQTENN